MEVELTKSAQLYLERKGLVETERQPRMHIAPDLHPVHTYPLATPLPIPAYLRHRDGQPAPDRATPTGDWPDQT